MEVPTSFSGAGDSWIWINVVELQIRKLLCQTRHLFEKAHVNQIYHWYMIRSTKYCAIYEQRNTLIIH